MLDNFRELIEYCIQKIKGEIVEDEWGNITFPTVDKVVECIPRHSVSIDKEVSLGYAVDLVLYTQEALIKTNEVQFNDSLYIIKRIEQKREHFKNYLVMKNV